MGLYTKISGNYCIECNKKHSYVCPFLVEVCEGCGNCLICGPVGSGSKPVLVGIGGGRVVFMGLSSSLSKHSVMLGVSAAGLSSSGALMSLCLDTSTVVAGLRQPGTLACVRNRLEMSVMSASVVS